MVSAWANSNNLVLRYARHEKSIENSGDSEAARCFVLQGTVVTIDAIGYQRSVASQIVEKKADYILAVKQNQGCLLDEVKDS